MDYENSGEERDIIYEKIAKTIEKSGSILHRKAVILIKSIKEQYGGEKFNGLEGIKTILKI